MIQSARVLEHDLQEAYCSYAIRLEDTGATRRDCRPASQSRQLCTDSMQAHVCHNIPEMLLQRQREHCPQAHKTNVHAAATFDH